ncbi:hypothetical protein [Burkholderia dolosa]|nr:hypothetical protein [Burkholderia dolosa]
MNIVVWDGEEKWEPESGVAIKIPDGVPVSIGYTYVDGIFSAPNSAE